MQQERHAIGAPWDVVIIGGGPAGLSAALTLGRARRRVLLCDAGPRRNAAAAAVHNFVTRDGTPPDEFRAHAHAQLAHYPSVGTRHRPVHAIDGTADAFVVQVGDDQEHARRILVCTGMVDERIPVSGFDALWGTSIFQCPYCHGYEVRDQRWGVLVHDETMLEHLVPFAAMLQAWTADVHVFATDAVTIPGAVRTRLESADIRVATSPVASLVESDGRLAAIALASEQHVPLDVLFAHPPQRHVELVRRLELALDAAGFIQVDPNTQSTSRPGVYAAGDATTRIQSAIVSAAAGSKAGAALNLDLALQGPASFRDTASRPKAKRGGATRQ